MMTAQSDVDTDIATQTHCLSTGSLDLEIHSQDMPDLYRIAERQNPKRAFLFVSTVLGRHIPVRPQDHRSVLDILARKVMPLLLQGPAFVMGYAETAVGIGAGVYDSLRNMIGPGQLGYLHTTRHPIPGEEVWFSIKEGHSHATDHFIMKPRGGVCRSGSNATLVLVDDETTTGSTFEQLALGLKENGAVFGRIVLVTLTDWSSGDAVRRIKKSLGTDQVRAVSLLEGAWSWKQNPEAVRPTLPVAKNPECPKWEPHYRFDYQSPRIGLKGREMSNGLYLAMKLRLPRVKRGDRVLVIGSGEHVWQPFLYSEVLAQDGIDAAFIATTRSPILPGAVIEHKITFPDHFGIGLDMYLHNVNPDDWDRIILFTETETSGVSEALRSGLGKGFIVDCHGTVSPMVSEGMKR